MLDLGKGSEYIFYSLFVLNRRSFRNLSIGTQSALICVLPSYLQYLADNSTLHFFLDVFLQCQKAKSSLHTSPENLRFATEDSACMEWP